MSFDATTVPVRVAAHRYDIFIRPGILSDVGSILASLLHTKRAAVITDSHVGPLHGQRVTDSLRAAGIDTVIATIPAGEDHKTLADLSSVFDQLLDHRMERSTPIIALGGGVVGDMAGFAAATLLRGVPFFQAPTSLLAMIDASVGGKTGINHRTGKNLIGAFHQPHAVIIDPQTLTTLPDAELRGGLAECIKHDIIRDAESFAQLEQHVSRALEKDIPFLRQLIAHNVSIKADIVEADPYETGERAHLNFGHTFGHAIETVSHYDYSHGECVALGMVAAARLASDAGMLAEESRLRIIRLIRSAGLPVNGLRLDPNQIVGAMSFDKKVRSGRIRFILPDRIGHVVIRDDLPMTAVMKAVESLMN